MAADKAAEESAKKQAEIDAADIGELRDENRDLRQQLADMVQVFEQYLKVASLKETAERM